MSPAFYLQWCTHKQPACFPGWPTPWFYRFCRPAPMYIDSPGNFSSHLEIRQCFVHDERDTKFPAHIFLEVSINFDVLRRSLASSVAWSPFGFLPRLGYGLRNRKFLHIIIEIDVTYPTSMEAFTILVIHLIPARIVTLLSTPITGTDCISSRTSTTAPFQDLKAFFHWACLEKGQFPDDTTFFQTCFPPGWIFDF